MGLGLGVELQGAFVLSGAVVAGSYLFLDSMTEGGVYILTRRVALAHFGSGNAVPNGIFFMGGLALFLA